MVAERVRRGVESEHTPERDTPLRRQLMVSGGVASLTEGTNTPKGPMEAADGAMYRAKRSGTNRTCVEGEPVSLGRRLEERGGSRRTRHRPPAGLGAHSRKAPSQASTTIRLGSQSAVRWASHITRMALLSPPSPLPYSCPGPGSWIVLRGGLDERGPGPCRGIPASSSR